MGTLAVGTVLAIATTLAHASSKLPSTLPTSTVPVEPSRWSGPVPTALVALALVESLGRNRPMVSEATQAEHFRAPTRTWSAATKTSANAVTKASVIVPLAFALASRVTLVHRASALLVPMTALDTELAAPTGTLLTTGPLLRLHRFNRTN